MPTYVQDLTLGSLLLASLFAWHQFEATSTYKLQMIIHIQHTAKALTVLLRRLCRAGILRMQQPKLSSKLLAWQSIFRGRLFSRSTKLWALLYLLLHYIWIADWTFLICQVWLSECELLLFQCSVLQLHNTRKISTGQSVCTNMSDADSSEAIYEYCYNNFAGYCARVMLVPILRH